MRKNTNIIQIRGIRGLIIAACVVCCLIAGFVVFPGWVCMHIWNFVTNYLQSVPSIGVIQGVILWSIIFLSYKALRKDKFFISVSSPKGLSEEELKEVFADLKKQSKEDPILQAMMKARESELKIKTLEHGTEESKETIDSDSTKV